MSRSNDPVPYIFQMPTHRDIDDVDVGDAGLLQAEEQVAVHHERVDAPGPTESGGGDPPEDVVADIQQTELQSCHHTVHSGLVGGSGGHDGLLFISI